VGWSHQDRRRERSVFEVIDRLFEAMNRHDASGMAACFAPDYDSQQPVHPNRHFTGNGQVQANWTALFQGVSDLRAERLESTSSGNVIWIEQCWSGTNSDGSGFLWHGVTISGVKDDAIAWQRLFMEPVELEGSDINTTVRAMLRPTAE
jgi:hypothetical protein